MSARDELLKAFLGGQNIGSDAYIQRQKAGYVEDQRGNDMQRAMDLRTLLSKPDAQGKVPDMPDVHVGDVAINSSGNDLMTAIKQQGEGRREADFESDKQKGYADYLDKGDWRTTLSNLASAKRIIEQNKGNIPATWLSDVAAKVSPGLTGMAEGAPGIPKQAMEFKTAMENVIAAARKGKFGSAFTGHEKPIADIMYGTASGTNQELRKKILNVFAKSLRGSIGGQFDSLPDVVKRKILANPNDYITPDTVTSSLGSDFLNEDDAGTLKELQAYETQGKQNSGLKKLITGKSEEQPGDIGALPPGAVEKTNKDGESEVLTPEEAAASSTANANAGEYESIDDIKNAVPPDAIPEGASLWAIEMSDGTWKKHIVFDAKVEAFSQSMAAKYSNQGKPPMMQKLYNSKGE